MVEFQFWSPPRLDRDVCQTEALVMKADRWGIERGPSDTGYWTSGITTFIDSLRVEVSPCGRFLGGRGGGDGGCKEAHLNE